MSASNWTTCPRCQAARAAELAQLNVDLAAAYGKVPVEEFDRLRAERDAQAAVEPERTFREDYEFWNAETGTLRIRYSGDCTSCRLGHKFTREETFWSSGAGT